MPELGPLKEFLAEYGYHSNLDIPEIAGQYAGKNVMVCGDAACIWDDLEAFGAKCVHGRGSVYKDDWDILTINKLIEIIPAKVEHCYSNEIGLLERFIAARRFEYRREFGPPKHIHCRDQGAHWRWPLGGHGTSGLGGTLVAVGLGYERIVLCGMPLDDSRHNGEPPWRQTAFTREAPDTATGGIPKPWAKAIDLCFGGKVRSMSGRTKQWLGAPDGW